MMKSADETSNDFLFKKYDWTSPSNELIKNTVSQILTKNQIFIETKTLSTLKVGLLLNDQFIDDHEKDVSSLESLSSSVLYIFVIKGQQDVTAMADE